jgi:hypothetical protein
MISPENVPGHMGFSPRPNPKLIATYPTKAPAVAVSRGLDRDRVVDETGNQTVVFGRRGSRPFNLEEMHAFYARSNSVYTVQDVVLKDGILRTESGAEVKPGNEFRSPTEKPVVSRAGRDRLLRRGQ